MLQRRRLSLVRTYGVYEHRETAKIMLDEAILARS